MPKALITGITGQDGSYLAEFLLEREYEVFGLVRSSNPGTADRIEHILDRIHLVEGDMLDEGSLVRALKSVGPDEVYNLAAHSFVQRSFGQPVFTADVTGLGVARILEAIREIYEGGAPMTPSIASKVLSMFKSGTSFSKDELYNLTEREMEILKCLVDGMSYKLVAEKCFVSIDTVSSHVKNIYRKLQVHSKSEAVAKAIRGKIV